MQIVLNKSVLTQGPQVQAGRGRSHCRGNYSLHGILMKASPLFFFFFPSSLFFTLSRAGWLLVLGSLLHCWPGTLSVCLLLPKRGGGDKVNWESRRPPRDGLCEPTSYVRLGVCHVKCLWCRLETVVELGVSCLLKVF